MRRVSFRGMGVIYAASHGKRVSFAPTRSLAYTPTMQNAEAGPSTVIDPFLHADTNGQTSPASDAPLRPLPSSHFYSIEYPGYVKPTSVSSALERLGGQASVDAAFKRTGKSNNAMLELNLRPGNPFSHPIPGDVLPTNNLVFKVVKRQRKRSEGAVDEPGKPVGEYTIQAAGIIPKTARFRSECSLIKHPVREILNSL